ncbi:MAG: DEAD/DEAH box helicase [Stenomitos frigidus ULC029]
MQQSLFKSEIVLVPLRDYQEKIIHDTYAIIRSAQQKEPIMIVSPTGSGKTFTLTRIMVDALRKSGAPSLFICDQDRLVKQTIKAFQKYGVTPGVIKAGYKPDPHAPIQVASIQSLLNRKFPSAAVIVIDEADKSFAASYRPVFEHYTDSWIFGCTATPMRTKKGESLSDLYKHMVLGPSVKALIQRGKETNWTEGLVEPEYHGFSVRADLSKVRTSMGDYNKADLKIACNTPDIIDRIPVEWYKLAASDGLVTARRTIVFCIDCDHSRDVAAAFNRQGIPAQFVDSKMTDAEVDAVFEAHQAGQFPVLCSVDMLTAGYDDPETSMLIMARPTKSLRVWLQQGGRGLRVAPWAGKTNCLVLDVAGNFGVGDDIKFGPFEADRVYSLDNPPKEPGEAPMRECPDCNTWLYMMVNPCPCGHVFPVKEKPKVELGEVVQFKSPDDRKRYKKFQSLLRMSMRKGFVPGYAGEVYKREYGDYPPNGWRLNATFPNPTEAEKKLYWSYLGSLVTTRKKTQEWRIREFQKEFGCEDNPYLYEKERSLAFS